MKILIVLAVAGLILAADKVLNEHAMTAAYERQATALERIAAASEGVVVKQWTH